MTVSRRKFLAGAAGVAAVSTLPTFSARAAEDFIIGTYGGLYSEILDAEVIPGFEQANNVSVQKELGWGSKFIPKIIASKANPPYDLVYVNEDESIFGDAAGLWEPMQPEATPNIAEIYDIAKPPALPQYTCTIYEFTCAYNPEKMDAPKSWGDLWNDKITLGVPHISSTYGMLFLQIAAELNGGGVDNLDPGFKALEDHPSMKIYKGVTDGFGKFRQGEMDAALFYRHRVQLLIDEGLSLDFTAPSEGTYGMRTGVRVVKNSRNVEAAHDWANRAMSAAYQEAFAPKLYSPSNKTVTLDAELAEKHVYGAEKVNSLKFGDWSVLNPKKPELLEKWNRTFTG